MTRLSLPRHYNARQAAHSLQQRSTPREPTTMRQHQIATRHLTVHTWSLNSKNGVVSSGTPWSGHTMNWYWCTMRSSEPLQQSLRFASEISDTLDNIRKLHPHGPLHIKRRVCVFLNRKKNSNSEIIVKMWPYLLQNHRQLPEGQQRANSIGPVLISTN